MAVEKLIFGKLPVSRGNWDQGTTYYKYNIVTQGSSSFMSVWNGDPFAGIQYKPGVYVDAQGNYIVTINGIPQGLNTTYWQLLVYGVDEASIVEGYTQADEVLKNRLLGHDFDPITAETILGNLNYAKKIDQEYREADLEVKSELVGHEYDSKDQLTLYGLRKYADTIAQQVQTEVIGTDQDTQDDLTLHGLRKYSDAISQQVQEEVIGHPTDLPTADTIYGLRKAITNETTARENADSQITTNYQNADATNRSELKDELLGTDSDDKDDMTIKGQHNYIEEVDNQVKNQIYAIGYIDAESDPETFGTVYIQCDTDNTLVNAEETEIDQTTGEVIVALNL
jgi:hypothetical protein